MNVESLLERKYQFEVENVDEVQIRLAASKPLFAHEQNARLGIDLKEFSSQLFLLGCALDNVANLKRHQDFVGNFNANFVASVGDWRI
jgi:hypothetical protein